jgi:hypothetical protein
MDELLSDSESGDSDATTQEEQATPKKKVAKGSGGRFKKSWNLPAGITSSTKGRNFAYCKLCKSHFGVSHGGFHDVSRHINPFTGGFIFENHMTLY